MARNILSVYSRNEEMTKANDAHEKLSVVLTKVEAMETQLNEIAAIIEKLNKFVTKLSKDAKKANQEKTREKRAGVSGFAIPIEVSDELRAFIDLPKGELISRVEATKKITSYIKENGLQSKENGRVILPDDKLEKLLDSQGQQVSWFTLQKFMKKHFVTAPKATA